MSVPEIQTPRLRLRGHRREDLDDCSAMWADSVVTRFISGIPSTRTQTWSRILAYAGHWSLVSYGYWVIEEKSTAAFVGETGFADFKRETIPAMQNAPELGFALATAMTGKGYASEAVRAVLEWGDAHLPARTVCLVNDANAASLRIVQNFGYRAFDRGAINGAPVVFLERTR